MVRHMTLDVSPPVHRGMLTLDRDKFRKSINILAAKVEPHRAGKVLQAKEMRKSVLDLRRIRRVLQTEDGDRLILLRHQEESELPPDAQQFLREESGQLVPYTLELDYSLWTAEEILEVVLPEELLAEAPSGFAVVGHIAHLNLNDEYLPYKYLIGQLILDKNSGHIKTVVNKLDSISNQFRVFQMEVIAGEPNFIVQHHESNCQFTFDFSEVYWNSRLHTEHGRLVDEMKPDDVLADVFAGVGPFALPAAKKGCAVFANDLNPNSYKYLVQNIQDNKVNQLVRPSCEDGRAFIRAVFNRTYDDPFPPVPPPKVSKSKLKLERKQRVQETYSASRSPERGASRPARSPSPLPLPPRRKRITQFSMNLPDTAIEFLDAFCGVLAPANVGERDLSGLYGRAGTEAMPMIHCYCFTRELEREGAEADIRQRVEERLGHPLGGEESFHLVRSVAPNKDMYCISFRLPYEVAFAA